MPTAIGFLGVVTSRLQVVVCILGTLKSLVVLIVRPYRQITTQVVLTGLPAMCLLLNLVPKLVIYPLPLGALIDRKQP